MFYLKEKSNFYSYLLLIYFRVHWIPVECYTNLDYAKRSTAADVWAFATTLWEIFTFGEEMTSNDHVEAMRVPFISQNPQFFLIFLFLVVCKW